jgi:hypothetical protein
MMLKVSCNVKMFGNNRQIRRENDIKMDRNVGCEDMDWIQLSERGLVAGCLF